MSEKQIKLYYAQALELIASCQGKNLIGKLMKNRQDVKEAYKAKIDDLILKISEIDENSPYISDIQKQLSDL